MTLFTQLCAEESGARSCCGPYAQLRVSSRSCWRGWASMPLIDFFFLLSIIAISRFLKEATTGSQVYGTLHNTVLSSHEGQEHRKRGDCLAKTVKPQQTFIDLFSFSLYVLPRDLWKNKSYWKTGKGWRTWSFMAELLSLNYRTRRTIAASCVSLEKCRVTPKHLNDVYFSNKKFIPWLIVSGSQQIMIALE